MFLHSSWTNHRLPIHFYTTLRRGAPGDHGKKKEKKKAGLIFQTHLYTDYDASAVFAAQTLFTLPNQHCLKCLCLLQHICKCIP